MFQRNQIFMVFAAILVSHHAVAQQDAPTDDAFAANKGIQNALRAFLSEDERKMFDGTEEQFRAKLTQLEQMAGGDHKKLIRELLHFGIQAKGMREAMLPGVLAARLAVSKGDIARGLLPYLEAKDDALRKASRDWLVEVEGNHADNNLDLSHYESIVREKKAAPPRELIKHMYEADAEYSVSVLAAVYLTKEQAKALADKVAGEDESVSLEALSKRTEWWAHLYVAEKMRKNPKLRSSAAVKRLETSKHPLVQEAIQRLEKQ